MLKFAAPNPGIPGFIRKDSWRLLPLQPTILMLFDQLAPTNLLPKLELSVFLLFLVQFKPIFKQVFI